MDRGTVHRMLFGDPDTEDVLLSVLLERLHAGGMHALDGVPREDQTGVYCLYHTGNDHRLYSGCGRDVPLYVGKAERGGLHRRLADHRKSIAQARDLDVAAFRCRLLPINDGWERGAERALVEHFRPLWNDVVRGFGNHAAGAGRVGQTVSRWDLLHPGRPWAEGLARSQGREEVEAEVAAWCEARGFRPRAIMGGGPEGKPQGDGASRVP